MLPPWDPSVKHCLGSQPVAWFVYRRRSNCASFLIGRQNTTFQTGNFQWCVTLRKLISYCCITQISWLQTWTVIVACHRWCIKPRYIPDMVETFLVLRDSNGNRNSSPMFFFSVWHHLRIPRVSKNMDASCRRKTNNGKRTRKQTQSNRFERGNAIHNGIMFNFYPGLLWCSGFVWKQMVSEGMLLPIFKGVYSEAAQLSLHTTIDYTTS